MSFPQPLRSATTARQRPPHTGGGPVALRRKVAVGGTEVRVELPCSGAHLLDLVIRESGQSFLLPAVAFKAVSRTQKAVHARAAGDRSAARRGTYEWRFWGGSKGTMTGWQGEHQVLLGDESRTSSGRSAEVSVPGPRMGPAAGPPGYAPARRAGETRDRLRTRLRLRPPDHHRPRGQVPRRRTGQEAAQVGPAEALRRRGRQGHRFYDWALADIADDRPGHHQLLVRRDRRTRELAFYRCYSATQVPLSTLVRVAGRGWTVPRRLPVRQGPGRTR